jgi:murein DD-endopeptidase MepM/ murein hydrolase activator NlpD
MRPRRVLSSLLLAASTVLLAACTTGGPLVLSRYRDLYDPRGAQRAGEHPAVDFGGSLGAPILAAAEGLVIALYQDGANMECGNGIRLWHDAFDRYTLYCQLADVKVHAGDRVARGQVIGSLGYTGKPSWKARPIPMLHFELSDQARYRGDGDVRGTYDPMQFIVGCYAPGRTYARDRLVLTYPVRC